MLFFAQDHWSSKIRVSDKFLHLSGSAAGTFVMLKYWPILVSCLIMGSLGFLLEVLQCKEGWGDGFSRKDLIADFIGIVSAVLVFNNNMILRISGVVIIGLAYLILEKYGSKRF